MLKKGLARKPIGKTSPAGQPTAPTRSPAIKGRKPVKAPEEAGPLAHGMARRARSIHVGSGDRVQHPPVSKRQRKVGSTRNDAVVQMMVSDVSKLSPQGLRRIVPRPPLPRDLWEAITDAPEFEAAVMDKLAPLANRGLGDQIDLLQAISRYLHRVGRPSRAPQIPVIRQFVETNVAEIDKTHPTSTPVELSAKWTKLLRLRYLVEGADRAVKFVKAIALSDLADHTPADRLGLIAEVPYDGPLGPLKDAMAPERGDWTRAVVATDIAGKVEDLGTAQKVQALVDALKSKPGAQRTPIRAELAEALIAHAAEPVDTDVESVLAKWNHLSDTCKLARLDRDGSIRLGMIESNIESLPETPQWNVLHQMSKQLHGSFEVAGRIRERLKILPKPLPTFGYF